MALLHGSLNYSSLQAVGGKRVERREELDWGHGNKERAYFSE